MKIIKTQRDMDDIVCKKVDELQAQYSSKKTPLRINFRKFVRSKLSIKRSDVFTHNIHSYPGRLFPYIPIFFLSNTRYCPPRGKVLDPFCGSGTVLLESIVNPFFKRDVYGIEINPLGRLISKVKTTPIDPNRLNRKIKTVLNLISEASKINNPKRSIPDFKNINIWYSEPAKNGLGLVKACIEKLRNDDCKDFLWLCFSKLARSVSNADPNIPPPVLLRINKYKDSYRYGALKKRIERNENPNVALLFSDIVHANADRIKQLWSIDEIKDMNVKSSIIGCDARKIRKNNCLIKGALTNGVGKKINNSISLIITSPPYLAAQKYVRSTKLELLWLGLTSETELHDLQKRTIGTESISLRTIREEIGIEAIDSLLHKIEKYSKERMLIAYEYFKNMKQTFNECNQVLKDDGYMVLVVGNNKIGNMTVNTAKLLTDLAQQSKFDVVYILRDEIKDRGMITKRHDTGGLIKDEFVVVLRKKKGNPNGAF